jgi:hypothetical protein
MLNAASLGRGGDENRRHPDQLACDVRRFQQGLDHLQAPKWHLYRKDPNRERTRSDRNTASAGKSRMGPKAC